MGKCHSSLPVIKHISHVHTCCCGLLVYLPWKSFVKTMSFSHIQCWRIINGDLTEPPRWKCASLAGQFKSWEGANICEPQEGCLFSLCAWITAAYQPEYMVLSQHVCAFNMNCLLNKAPQKNNHTKMAMFLSDYASLFKKLSGLAPRRIQW